MKCLNSDGSATYLLINWVEKKYTVCDEIEIKSISLNCFSKYILFAITAADVVPCGGP